LQTKLFVWDYYRERLRMLQLIEKSLLYTLD